MVSVLQVVGDGLVGSFAQAAVAAGTLLVVMMVVALGAFAYRNLRGDGVEWPDESEESDEVRRGDTDDEWDYY